jgi:fucose permease
MTGELDATLDRLGLIIVGGTSGYIISSFMTGAVLRLIGVSWLLIGSGLLTTVGLILVTVVDSWLYLPFIALISGLGGGGIDAALNTYVEKHYSGRVMQWLHASFGVGVTIGPLIMTGALVATGQWRVGYLVVIVLMLLMIATFLYFRKLWDDPDQTEEVHDEPSSTLIDSLRLPVVWFSMATFFFYTSVEIGVGMWSFTLLTESRGVSVEQAGFWVSVYWGSFTVGRLVAGLLSERLGDMKMTLIGLSMSYVGIMGYLFVWPGPGGVYSLVLIGFGLAPTFPALISTTSERVPKSHVANTVGMQIAAAGVGMLIIPGVMTWAVGLFGIEIIVSIFAALLALVLVTVGILNNSAKNNPKPV